VDLGRRNRRHIIQDAVKLGRGWREIAAFFSIHLCGEVENRISQWLVVGVLKKRHFKGFLGLTKSAQALRICDLEISIAPLVYE